MTGSLTVEPSSKTRIPRSVTGAIVAVAAVLIVALFIFVITQHPANGALPVSLGFSLNSFFVWIGGLTPLLQIPIVIAVFAVVVGLILVLVEFAPRAGRGYFWLRVAA